MANLEELRTPNFVRRSPVPPPAPARTTLRVVPVKTHFGDEAEEPEDGVVEEALEPDQIEVEAGLPEPSPLTEERAQRLEAIKARVIEIYPRYKKYARRMHTIMVEMGRLLIEAKGIVGHGRFMTWVNENMPFSHSTADNYMKLIRDLKFTTLTNLALKGAVNAVEFHFQHKRAVQARKREQEEKAERRAELPQSPLERKRQRKQLRFLENRTFKQEQHRAAQQARSEQYQAQDLLDLTELSRPQDAARIEIEWDLPAPEGQIKIQGIYVWLSEYGHADAKLATRKTSWKGSVALRYHWILYTKGNDAKDYSVAVDHGRFDDNYNTWTDGDTWEEVQAKLSELSQNATRIRRAELMDRDPAAVGILENWRVTHQRRRRCPRCQLEEEIEARQNEQSRLQRERDEEP